MNSVAKKAKGVKMYLTLEGGARRWHPCPACSSCLPEVDSVLCSSAASDGCVTLLIG
jgi:hypothetical protein